MNAHPDTAPIAPEESASYRLAAIAALLVVASALLDIGLMFIEPQTIVPGASGAAEWLGMLHDHRFLSLRNLGLLNAVNLLLEIPLFLALYQAHPRAQRGLAAAAVALLLVGASVYIARNPVFSLDALARRYFAAAPDQRAALLASAEVLLALGEDLTAGTFAGFFVTELAGLVLSLAMLRGRVLGAWPGRVGLVGFGSLLVFNVFAAFAPELYGKVLALGTLGGLAMVGWYVLVARGLLRLGRSPGGRP